MKGLSIYDSKIPGPTTLIVGLVHGNESVGGCIKQNITRMFSRQGFIGKILFLIGNPEAAKRNIRFVDQDLNRSFGEYDHENHEILRAREIKTFFETYEKIDYVFDLHSTQSESAPMIICTKNPHSQKLAQYFPFQYVIGGLIEQIEGVSLTRYFSSLGAIDLAFECGSHDNPHNQKVANMIIDTIFQIQNRERPKKTTNQITIEITDLIYTSCPHFIFTQDYQGFETIQAGEVFARENGVDRTFDRDKIIVIPRLGALKELSIKDEVVVGYLGEIQ